MDERNRFVRGLVAWVGFRSIGVEHEREERYAGTSKAHSTAVLQLAVKAVLAHSQVPLVIIPLVGISLFVASIVALVVLTIDWATLGVPFPGFGTIVALMVMLFGILFCLLGIVSIYIGQIYEEVKGRAQFCGSPDPRPRRHADSLPPSFGGYGQRLGHDTSGSATG